MILQILPHKLQGLLIGYALGDALLLNFSIARQNSHIVVQEKSIPKLGFIHGYKTQQILQYLVSSNLKIFLQKKFDLLDNIDVWFF